MAIKSVDPFPRINNQKKEDENPAIQLYGRRFDKDQTEIEYLVEFLLVFASPKKIGEHDINGSNQEGWQGFPDTELLRQWPVKSPLTYQPRSALILKLFTFLGASDLETRHQCHRDQFQKVIQDLRERIHTGTRDSKDDILYTIEKVLLGFIGIGGNRTWCAHSFLPVAPGLITGETIWSTSKGKKYPLMSWEDAFYDKIFIFGQHDFLARGGEVLYLQLCNFFQMSQQPEDPQFEKVQQFEREMGFDAGSMPMLQSQLENGLQNMLRLSPAPELDALVKWIEMANGSASEYERSTPAICGWCPQETWPEAGLFAWEMVNICQAHLELIEKIEMLKICCVMQVMRTLCAQAARYWTQGLSETVKGYGSPVGKYAWIISNAATDNVALKSATQKNLLRIQEMIHGAIRTRTIQHLKKGATYKGGDEQAQDLFIKLGKKLGIIAPYNGPGTRFILTDTLLRYWVLTLVPAGQRMTLDSFQERLYTHYGAAIGGKWLQKAFQWTFATSSIHPPSLADDQLEDKLKAIGLLFPLSDDVSLIENPFTPARI